MRPGPVQVTIPWLVVLAGLAGLAACDQGGDVSLEAQETAREPLTRDEQKRFDDLTIREIMQGPGLVGTAPSNTRFSADGKTVKKLIDTAAPADIGLDRERGLLYVPLFFESRVEVYQLQQK